MSIIGVGSDIINIERIRKIYNKFGASFLEKNFHTEEIKYFKQLSDKRQISYLAKRFAGKEAVAKAFGRGIGELAFRDIAILNDEHGAPYVELYSQNVPCVQKNLKINISLSDDEPFAVAFVVINH